MTDLARTLVFACEGSPLIGQLHEAEGRTGVLMVNGGVQTRVGAHRSYVDLARGWAAAGLPVLRFDRRGTGDSGGSDSGYLGATPDIEAALAALVSAGGAERYIGFGLCDGATALALAAADDPRCVGLVLLNPWTIDPSDDPSRVTAGQHYRRRLRDPRTLRRLLRGEVHLGRAMRSLGRLALDKARARKAARPLAGRLAEALTRIEAPVLVLVSEHDATAAAFEAVTRSPAWQPVMAKPTVSIRRLAGADHSCSQPEARAALLRLAWQWVAEQAASRPA